MADLFYPWWLTLVRMGVRLIILHNLCHSGVCDGKFFIIFFYFFLLDFFKYGIEFVRNKVYCLTLKNYLDMKRNEILNVIRQLSMSQGFYGRLLRDMETNEEFAEEVLTELERQNFGDAVDLVMYIEG